MLLLCLKKRKELFCCSVWSHLSRTVILIDVLGPLAKVTRMNHHRLWVRPPQSFAVSSTLALSLENNISHVTGHMVACCPRVTPRAYERTQYTHKRDCTEITIFFFVVAVAGPPSLCGCRLIWSGFKNLGDIIWHEFKVLRFSFPPSCSLLGVLDMTQVKSERAQVLIKPH